MVFIGFSGFFEDEILMNRRRGRCPSTRFFQEKIKKIKNTRRRRRLSKAFFRKKSAFLQLQNRRVLLTCRQFLRKKKDMALILPVRGYTPKIGNDCFTAPNATLVGEVEMGDFCSVWFGAVVRGDVHYIKIGHHTNIQDNVTIHGTYQTAPTHIGNYVTIGHNAVVHGCTLEDYCLIGMGARVLDNAVVQKGAIVAAGAVVLENTVVESGWIYAGVPAKKVKQVGDREEMLHRIANNYIKYASWFKEEAQPPAQSSDVKF